MAGHSPEVLGDARMPVHPREAEMCQHQPRCPDVGAPDHQAARVVASHPEQGWSLLCNGVLLFDDAGELLPDGRAVAPEPTCLVAAA
jgi:hypothetical protein